MRHTMLPEVGEAGRPSCCAPASRSGAGGLGSPSGLYLGAAGVGTLGIVDDDVVDASESAASGAAQHVAHRRAQGGTRPSRPSPS